MEVNDVSMDINGMSPGDVLSALKVGQSIILPEGETLRVAARRRGIKIRTRRFEGQFRVWRVA